MCFLPASHQHLLRWAALAQVLLGHKDQVPRDEGERHAFSTSLTKEQLQEQLHRLSAEVEQAQLQLQEEVTRLKGAGLLQQSVDMERLTACVMGRLNPRQYPDRPEVCDALCQQKERCPLQG